MLNLESGVDLEEVEASTGVDEEFHGAGVRVARGFGDPHRGGTKILAKAVVHGRPRGLLDQLLMTTLHRTIAFSEPDDVAGTIREGLHRSPPARNRRSRRGNRSPDGLRSRRSASRPR